MGSDISLCYANEEYLERCAVEIAGRAAMPVALHKMERMEAIRAATEEIRQENAAHYDVTGVLGTMIDVAPPSKTVSQAQIKAIQEELIDLARDAAETLLP
ncbi:hypothetical protein V8J88_23205 [Massilia sp. W12]|uniref:hypothetical protein n=1 Tax=Massilia sp. W12 TaxID=3126507 RepID=UPI0030D541CF